MKQSTDLLQGTLDLLILKSLAVASMHGWGIAERIQQVSKDALQIGQGSLAEMEDWNRLTNAIALVLERV